MRQKKLVIGSLDLAHRLRDKVAQHRPGRKFEVYTVDLGFQVVEIRQCRSAMPPRIPLPVSPGAAQLIALTPLTPVIPAAAIASVTLPCFEESRAYIGVVIDGVNRWFGKTTLVGWEIAEGKVTLRLPRKQLIKRGFENLGA